MHTVSFCLLYGLVITGLMFHYVSSRSRSPSWSNIFLLCLLSALYLLNGWKDDKILVTCDKDKHTKLICRTRFTISVQDQGHRSRSAAYSDLFPKYLLSSFNDLHMPNMLTGYHICSNKHRPDLCFDSKNNLVLHDFKMPQFTFFVVV